ncbi:MAG TPA: hypothetical protein VFK06_24615 [Candidatus Angelobacter sp.]|nr:hypothetical protein [Candidatus Angelobacter sp.]
MTDVLTLMLFTMLIVVAFGLFARGLPSKNNRINVAILLSLTIISFVYMVHAWINFDILFGLGFFGLASMFGIMTEDVITTKMKWEKRKKWRLFSRQQSASGSSGQIEAEEKAGE